MADFRDSIAQLRKIMGGMSPRRRIFFAGLLLSVGGGLLWMMHWSYESSFVPLFSKLTPEDASQIVARLKESKIPYELAKDGSTIAVPSRFLYETRLELASQGLPSSGNVGFEIFDKNRLGTSGYVEKVQFHRALEGELSRTVAALEEVISGRVHLALPEPARYFGDKPVPTASVALRLVPGATLSRRQIRGVVHLVARAVEGLTPENVTIVDAFGNLLSGSGGIADSGAHNMRSMIERELETRGQSMLEKVYGPGNIVLRVHADVDSEKFETTREIYEPAAANGLVRTLHEVRETSSNAPAANPEGAEEGAEAGARKSDLSRRERDVQYEINKRVERLIKTPGAIRRLSVAVLVGKESVDETERGRIQTMLGAALGIDPQRGDVLTVEGMTFDKSLDEENREMRREAEKRRFILDLVRYGIVALGGISFLLAFRWVIKVLTTPKPVPAGGAAQGAGGVPGAQLGGAPIGEGAGASVGAAPSVAGRSAPGSGKKEGGGKAGDSNEPSAESLQASLSVLAQSQPELFSRAISRWLDAESKEEDKKKTKSNKEASA